MSSMPVGTEAICRSQQLNLGFPTCLRDPTTWAITYHFPLISTYCFFELGGELAFNIKHSHMGCKNPKWCLGSHHSLPFSTSLPFGICFLWIFYQFSIFVLLEYSNCVFFTSKVLKCPQLFFLSIKLTIIIILILIPA